MILQDNLITRFSAKMLPNPRLNSPAFDINPRSNRARGKGLKSGKHPRRMSPFETCAHDSSKVERKKEGDGMWNGNNKSIKLMWQLNAAEPPPRARLKNKSTLLLCRPHFSSDHLIQMIRGWLQGSGSAI